MKNKVNYRKHSDKELKSKLKEMEIELLKSQGMMGKAKVKKKEKALTSKGSDISKRLRREKARILTEMRRRELDNE